MIKSLRWGVHLGLAFGIISTILIVMYRIWPEGYVDLNDVGTIMLNFNYLGMALGNWLTNIFFGRGIGPE